jgi:hypothetical protein
MIRVSMLVVGATAFHHSAVGFHLAVHSAVRSVVHSAVHSAVHTAVLLDTSLAVGLVAVGMVLHLLLQGHVVLDVLEAGVQGRMGTRYHQGVHPEILVVEGDLAVDGNIVVQSLV